MDWWKTSSTGNPRWISIRGAEACTASSCHVTAVTGRTCVGKQDVLGIKWWYDWEPNEIRSPMNHGNTECQWWFHLFSIFHVFHVIIIWEMVDNKWTYDPKRFKKRIETGSSRRFTLSPSPRSHLNHRGCGPSCGDQEQCSQAEEQTTREKPWDWTGWVEEVYVSGSFWVSSKKGWDFSGKLLRFIVGRG